MRIFAGSMVIGCFSLAATMAVASDDLSNMKDSLPYPGSDCIRPGVFNPGSLKSLRGLRAQIARYHRCTEAYVQAADEDIKRIVEMKRKVLKAHNAYVGQLKADLSNRPPPLYDLEDTN